MPSNEGLHRDVEAVLDELRANPALVDEIFRPSPKYFTGEHLRTAMTYLTARAERAEAAIAAVRSLHVRMADNTAPKLGFTAPDMCRADGETWPCPTAAALDSTQLDVPAPGRSGEEKPAVDLMAALRASVDRARASRGEEKP